MAYFIGCQKRTDVPLSWSESTLSYLYVMGGVAMVWGLACRVIGGKPTGS